VTLEIFDGNGELVQSFASDQESRRPNASVYFADLWLGEPPRPATGPGHHRFVWDLRFPPPPTLRSSYSIAAVPGRPTPARPQGAFVLPGRYEVRLTAGDRTVSQPLEVAMDPRVEAGPTGLAALLDFQRQVAALLERAVGLAKQVEEASGAPAAANEIPDEDVQEVGQTARSVASVLTSLTSDLESVDLPPTEPQRALLANETERLEVAEVRWRE
jgi:hypothetical protein